MLQQARCYQHGRLWIMATVLQVMTLISLVVYCAMRDNQSPSRWFNNTRPTKHALALYTITVDHESCMTARLDVTPKTTEQNRIVRTGKSEAEVTNNKKLHSRYCTTERHEASCGLIATAKLLVYYWLLRLQIYHCIQLNSVLFVMVLHAARCDKHRFTDASPSVR